LLLATLSSLYVSPSVTPLGEAAALVLASVPVPSSAALAAPSDLIADRRVSLRFSLLG